MTHARMAGAAVLALAALALAWGVIADTGAGTQPPAQADAAAWRRHLAAAPLDSAAYTALATAAASANAGNATPLDAIVVRRAPRDLQAHLRMARAELHARNFARAIAQFDLLFRIAPKQTRPQLIPALLRMAQMDPRFADALLDALLQRPGWRSTLVQFLFQRDAPPTAAAIVLGGLQRRGALDAAESDAWLEGLMQRGDWGEAYARWASALALAGGTLPALYNGGFDHPPTGKGFDWRVDQVPGVLLEFPPEGDGHGRQAHATFLGRSVQQIGLAHPLLLAPGRYRLTARVRTAGLHSVEGLAWSLACAGGKGAQTGGERIKNDAGWRTVSADLDVPVGPACPRQWLRLLNPAARGAAQTVSGELWLDDVAIVRRRDGEGPP